MQVRKMRDREKVKLRKKRRRAAELQDNGAAGAGAGRNKEKDGIETTEGGAACDPSEGRVAAKLIAFVFS